MLGPLARAARAVDARVPAELDDLVTRCVAHDPAKRPKSARLVADAIESFFSGERERADRQRTADDAANEGDVARAEHERLRGEARRLQDASRSLLAELPSWEGARRSSQLGTC